MITALVEMFLTLVAKFLRPTHRMRFRAEGDSMAPTIRSGDMIMVEPLAVRDLLRGDIVLYRASRGVAAQRIVRIDPDRLLVQGDARTTNVESITPSRILGKVVRVIPDSRQGAGAQTTEPPTLRRGALETLAPGPWAAAYSRIERGDSEF